MQDNWIKIEDGMPDKDFGKYLVTNGTDVGESTWVKRTTKEAPQLYFSPEWNINLN